MLQDVGIAEQQKKTGINIQPVQYIYSSTLHIGYLGWGCLVKCFVLSSPLCFLVLLPLILLHVFFYSHT